jgi:hypothetical protein
MAMPSGLACDIGMKNAQVSLLVLLGRAVL